jgi:hypothetical protein
MCNLADIERKLELYKAMFYHNIPSYRDTNYVTSDSLKIELIAGGLNFKQQEFVMKKLEPSRYGEVSRILKISVINHIVELTLRHGISSCSKKTLGKITELFFCVV